MARQHTHYENLKVSRNAPPEVIRAAYKALSQRYHPDKNSSSDATRIMKILNEAYEILGDAGRRQRYDATLIAGADETADSAAEDAKRDGSPQAKAGHSKPQAAQATDSPPPFAANVRPAEAVKKKRSGWFWIVGIVVAILVRMVVSESNNKSNTQVVVASPDVNDTSSAASAALVGVSVVDSKIITSFDCKKAHSTSEKLICSDAELASLDLGLATVFAQAKAVAPDKKAFAASARTTWNWRNANCFNKSCLVTWYNEQRERLTAILNQPVQSLTAASEPPFVSTVISMPGQIGGVGVAQPVSTSSENVPSNFYAERVARRVRPNIVWAGESNGLETVIDVRVGRTGSLLSATIVRASSNPRWDAAALRAVERSDPLPLDVSGEAPASFTITLSPSGDKLIPPQSGRGQAISWAHSLAQHHADANVAYDTARQKLAGVSLSCPDTVLLQQTPQRAGPHKPVVMFLSQQCGYIASYWPESGEEQISFDRSTIENWSESCSRDELQTSCVKGSGV